MSKKEKRKKKVAYSGARTQATRVVAQSLPVTLICPLTTKASIWRIYSDFKANRSLSRKRGTQSKG